MPTWPDFPEDEFRNRLSKAQSAMKEHDLDALFLTEWENVYYMSGFQSGALINSRDWPYALIVKRDGDSTFVVRGGFEAVALETSWISNIQAYRMLGDARDAIRKGLEVMGLKGAKVGAELGETQAVRFSTGVFLDLVNTAGVNFVDGARAIWDMRTVKSKLEVDRIREAARIASRAAERAFTKLREGMTEREFSRLVGQYMMEEGAQSVRMPSVRSGERFRRYLGGGFPSDTKIKKGDYLQMDWGAMYHQYSSDLHRIAIIGTEPTRSEKDHWNLFVEANEQGTQAVRPGVTAASVFAAMAKVFEEAGIKVDMFRFGHGLGLDLHEPPHLGPHDKTLIKPGMVFAIEPYGVRNKEGITFNCEDDVACTETGVERLSTIKREIFVV